MSTVKPFHLPDLGEGLPDAEIVEWHVKIGDVVRLDAPLVSMETAKAVVDVPSPFSGKVLALAGYRAAIALGGSVPLPQLFATAGARFAFDATALQDSVDLLEATLADLETQN